MSRNLPGVPNHVASCRTIIAKYCMQSAHLRLDWWECHVARDPWEFCRWSSNRWACFSLSSSGGRYVGPSLQPQERSPESPSVLSLGMQIIFRIALQNAPLSAAKFLWLLRRRDRILCVSLTSPVPPSFSPNKIYFAFSQVRKSPPPLKVIVRWRLAGSREGKYISGCAVCFHFPNVLGGCASIAVLMAQGSNKGMLSWSGFLVCH